MDSLCSHHAAIQYLYLIYTIYNVIILPFHSCKKKREPFTALFDIDFLIHLSYSTVWQPMSLNFFPKMGQSLVLHQMPSQLLSFEDVYKRQYLYYGKNKRQYKACHQQGAIIPSSQINTGNQKEQPITIT